MLDELISAYGSRFLVAALGVSLALLCLFIVLWVLRNRAPSPFVRGGRNRQPRLQVLDAAAIDARRRIVLIRRDNVEHLVMIGGPTDLVIEAGIGDERHYMTARALQAQAAEEEARLAHQTASLPAVEVAPSAALVRDSRVETPASAAAREPLPAPRVQASDPTVQPPVQTAQAIAAKAEIAAPRPVTPPIATPPLAKANAAPPPISPVVAAATAAAPIVVAPVPSTPVHRPSDPIAASAPSAESRSEPQAATTTVSATFSPELHAEPAPVEAAPAIVLDRPAEAVPQQAPNMPVMTSAADPVLRPLVTNEQERPTAAASPAQPPQATLAVAPQVELGQSPRIAPPAAFDTQRSAEVAPSTSPDISSPMAEDVLEAARARVLVPPGDQGQIRPFDQARFVPDRERGFAGDIPPTATARDEGLAAREMSDFERVLEDEMALHIAADPGPSLPQTSPASPIPALLPETRPDRPRPPLGTMVAETRQPTAPAGANTAPPAEEPNLQNEIARIFGEMSASRNP